MTTAQLISPSFPAAPADPIARRNFRLAILLLLTLCVSLTVAGFLLLQQLAARQENANDLLKQRLAAIDKALLPIQETKRQNLNLKYRLDVMAQLSTQQNLDAQMLGYAAQATSSQFLTISRQDDTLLLLASVPTRLAAFKLLQSLENQKLLTNPHINGFQPVTAKQAPGLAVAIVGTKPAPEITEPLTPDREPSKSKTIKDLPGKPLLDLSSLPETLSWILIFGLLGLILLGLAYGIRSLSAPEKSLPARVYDALGKLDAWQVQSWPRTIRLLALLEFGLLLLLVIWLALSSPLENLDEANHQYLSLSEQIQQKSRAVASSEALQQEHARLSSAWTAYTPRLAFKWEPQAFWTMLQALADTNQVHLANLNRESFVQEDTALVSQTVHIHLQGTARNIARFMQQLPDMPVLISVSEYEWKQASPSAPQATLDATLRIVTELKQLQVNSKSGKRKK